MTVKDTLPRELVDYVVEAVADHMRLPKGPNSRDDADDRPLDKPMDHTRTNIEEQVIKEDAQDIFTVRHELLDLEEDLQVALDVLDDFITRAGAPRGIHAALDRAHRVASRLHDAAGLSRQRPPALPK